MVINRGGPEERKWGERNMRGIYVGCLGGLFLWVIIGMIIFWIVK